MFRFGSEEGYSCHRPLAEPMKRSTAPSSRPLCPSSRPEVTKAGVVRLLHAVWFGGSETPAHAWTVHFCTVASEVGKDRVVPVWDVACGAVSRHHQHHATTHALGRSFRFAKCGDCRCSILRQHPGKCMLRGMQPTRPGMRVDLAAARLNDALSRATSEVVHGEHHHKAYLRTSTTAPVQHTTWPRGDMRIKLSIQAPRSALLSQAFSRSPSQLSRPKSALAVLAGMRSATCIFAPPPPCNDGISVPTNDL